MPSKQPRDQAGRFISTTPQPPVVERNQSLQPYQPGQIQRPVEQSLQSYQPKDQIDYRDPDDLYDASPESEELYPSVEQNFAPRNQLRTGRWRLGLIVLSRDLEKRGDPVQCIV
jgi:hypothetical protein